MILRNFLTAWMTVDGSEKYVWKSHSFRDAAVPEEVDPGIRFFSRRADPFGRTREFELRYEPKFPF